jgi:hypothetical protein
MNTQTIAPMDQSEFKLHKRQWEVYRSTARFRVLVAGRRFGKTHLALVEMIRAAQSPGRIVWYVGPTDDQAKRVVWERLKNMTRQWWSHDPDETHCVIHLHWGSTLSVSGGFAPDSLRGDGLDFVVLDESATLKPNLWSEILMPALTDREGRALFIGTPKGRNHFYEYFEYAQSDDEWQSFQFTTGDGGLVTAAELAKASRRADVDTFRQEFEGNFTTTARNRAYYAFDPAVHVKPLSFDMLRPLVWSIDFNVNPMCMLLLQRIDDMVHVLEEIVIKPDANTEKACQAFLARAMHHQARVPHYLRPVAIQVYGDASGNQRRTSGTSTDWALIRQFFGQWRGTFEPAYYTATMNPGVRERVSCVNSRLTNLINETHLFIDPSCVELIKDLEQVTWVLDSTGAATGQLNKSDKARTHASDALGYYISQVFPLKPPIGPKSSGRLL